MSLLWDRKASVIFGPKGEEGKKISGLRVSFDITKTSESTANTAKIQVYNLNEDSRGILKTKDALFLALEVGYGTDIDQIFSGDISRSFTQRQGADFVTTIEIEDGGQALTEAKLDKSYASGTPEKTIIQDALDAMKETGAVIIGELSNLKDDVVQNGFSASGTAKKILDKLVTKQGLEYHVQDNEVLVLDPAKDDGDEALVLTPTTGLIGSPSIGKTSSKEEGIEFKALIQTTKFRPGRAVQLITRDMDGFFRVLKSKFQGDTHAPAWYVTCEALPL